MPHSTHRRGRWMAPAMIVLAGMVAGAPAGAGRPAGDDVVEVPEWRNAFDAAGVRGALVLRRLGDRRSFVSDLDAARSARPPASTFKIPHLLIALETAVVRDVEQVYAWDGRARPVAAWNADHTVREAVQVSSVPVFQQIARSIGADRMADWLHRLGYGNASVDGGVDRFWLNGGLRVTPVQQVDFVERLLLGTLPASSHAQTAARDVVPSERVGCTGVIHAKTGRAQTGWSGGSGPDVGWWVGWVEVPDAVWVFATLVEGDPETVGPARRRVTLDVLDRTGIGACGGAATSVSMLEISR